MTNRPAHSVDVVPREHQLLQHHLAAWLGAWPPAAPIMVVGSPRRERPAWDGRPRRFVGVGTPSAAVLSVPPDRVEAVRKIVSSVVDMHALAGETGIAAALDAGDLVLGRGVFRYGLDVASPVDLPDAGEWVESGDARLPEWLRPFNGGVVVAWDDVGDYGAGVGIKRHDRVGHELAVVTEPRVRGRGIGRRLVAQAARKVIADGGLPTYLHDPANAASARVADAVGFPDRGWSVWSLFTAS